MAFTALGTALILGGVSNVLVKTILSIPLVFILPGYTLMVVLFPKNEFDPIERLLFSLGLSLAIVVLGGLVLNWMPWGLQADSWVMLLGGITIGVSLVAFFRYREYPSVDPEQLSIGLSYRQVLLLGLAALLIIGAMMLARMGALQQPSPAFTQLWILSADDTDESSVRVGVRSMEPSTKQYRLQVRVSDQVTHEVPLIELNPSETWESDFVLPMENNESGNVEAILYLLDNPEVAYRRVRLWHKG